MHLPNFLPIGAGGNVVYTDSPRLPLHHPAEVKRPSSEIASPQKSSGEYFIAMLATKLLMVILIIRYVVIFMQYKFSKVVDSYVVTYCGICSAQRL